MAGAYELNAHLADRNGVSISGHECQLPITITAESNTAYVATFKKSGCSWAPEDLPF